MGQEEGRGMLCEMHEMMFGIFQKKQQPTNKNVCDEIKSLVVSRREEKVNS